MHRLLLVCPLGVGLAACSDYDLIGKDQNGGVDTNGETGGPGTDTEGDTGGEDSDPRSCSSRDYPGGSLAQNEECYEPGPTVGTFTPVLEWSKQSFTNVPGSTQVMMMPAVGSLTDDDGDGDADEDDVPDIVFITYSGSGSTPYVLRAISGDGGAEIFGITDNTLQGQGGVALGDLNGDGWTDIVAATTNGVRAYDRRGSVLWTNSSLGGHIYGVSDNPAISDMDGDGNPEVIMGNGIISNTGALIGAGRSGMAGVAGNNVGTTAVAVDIDGDGQQELVTGNALYNRAGVPVATNSQTDGYVAVGNFDADDAGEIVVSTGGQVRLQDDDMSVLCSAAIPGAGSSYYGGPPTIADFDGDGEAEFALAAGSRYSVFERDCRVKWQATTQDASSGNTGSAVFDFEGDGVAEAIYADEVKLWAFNGPDGAVKLSSDQHSNATWLEYPTIADVDGDGQAEIVVANTDYQRSIHGLTVFGDADASWMPGRRIWNQHAYHITNVNDDGSIPATAERNWLTYNNFRSGDLTAGGGYTGPDLVVEVEGICLDECDEQRLFVWVSVGNAGYTDVTEDVPLEIIGTMEDGTERSLATYTITDLIPAGQTLDGIQFVIEGVTPGVDRLRATVDGGNAGGSVGECDETNNEDPYNENLCP